MLIGYGKFCFVSARLSLKRHDPFAYFFQSSFFSEQFFLEQSSTMLVVV